MTGTKLDGTDIGTDTETGTGMDAGTEGGAWVNTGNLPPVDAFPGSTVFPPTVSFRRDLRDLVLRFELTEEALDDDLEPDLELEARFPTS